MPNRMDCCSTHESIADELADLASDPTLQDCCRRDLQEQAHVARVKSRLLAVDRVDKRAVLAKEVVKPPPPVRESFEDDDSGADDAGILDWESFRRMRDRPFTP